MAGLRLRADQAGLSADFPGIGDPAGVLHGGVRARIPFPRELDGFAVAESAPRLSGKISLFRQPKNIASGFAGDLRLFDWGSSSPESVHCARAAGMGSHRSWFPSGRLLTPLSEVVGSRLTKGADHVWQSEIPRRSAYFIGSRACLMVRIAF